MKNLLLLITLAFMVVATGYSQTSQTSAASVMTVTSATYSGTRADTATYKATGSYNNVTIQAVITKVSGTVAGTAVLYGSLDGINYQYIPTSDTLTLSNQTTNHIIWPLGQGKYLYYRVKVDGSGTMVASFKSWFLGRQ